MIGQEKEARAWQQQAQHRYDELLEKHANAFADHAAEFFLAAGRDPARALHWARFNLAVRHTPRAQALLVQAEQAMQAAKDDSAAKDLGGLSKRASN